MSKSSDLFVVDPDGVQSWLVGEVGEVAHAVVAGGGEVTDGPVTAGANLATGLDLELLSLVHSDGVRSFPPQGADINVPVDSGVEYFAGVRLRDLLGLVQVRADQDGGEVEGVSAELRVSADVLGETKGMLSRGRGATTSEDDEGPPGQRLVSSGGAGLTTTVLQHDIPILSNVRTAHSLPQAQVTTSLSAAD